MKNKQIKVILQSLPRGGFRVEQLTNAVSVTVNPPDASSTGTRSYSIGEIIERAEDARALCADTRYEVTVKSLK